jgi:osmotically-inducible protein OsmY
MNFTQGRAMPQRQRRAHRLPLAALLIATLVTSACAPLLIGGAVVGGGLVVTDRRTTGTQVEDQGIELKGASRVRDQATLGRVNVTSYNRVVLLSGEVPTEGDKAAVEAAVAKVENVKAVINELAVMPNASVGTRSNDTLLSGKVKATLVDAKDVQANAFKVVTERGIVYMMGRVTEREAARAADLARAVPGVQKVVRAVEVLTEQELAALGPASAPPAASAPR